MYLRTLWCGFGLCTTVFPGERPRSTRVYSLRIAPQKFGFGCTHLFTADISVYLVLGIMESIEMTKWPLSFTLFLFID